MLVRYSAMVSGGYAHASFRPSARELSLYEQSVELKGKLVVDDDAFVSCDGFREFIPLKCRGKCHKFIDERGALLVAVEDFMLVVHEGGEVVSFEPCILSTDFRYAALQCEFRHPTDDVVFVLKIAVERGFRQMCFVTDVVNTYFRVGSIFQESFEGGEYCQLHVVSLLPCGLHETESCSGGGK